jgi:hypothetical protein
MGIHGWDFIYALEKLVSHKLCRRRGLETLPWGALGPIGPGWDVALLYRCDSIVGMERISVKVVGFSHLIFHF